MLDIFGFVTGGWQPGGVRGGGGATRVQTKAREMQREKMNSRE